MRVILQHVHVVLLDCLEAFSLARAACVDCTYVEISSDKVVLFEAILCLLSMLLCSITSPFHLSSALFVCKLAAVLSCLAYPDTSLLSIAAPMARPSASGPLTATTVSVAMAMSPVTTAKAA